MFFEQVNYGAQFLSLRTILRTNSWLACSIYWVERSAGRVTGETEGATGFESPRSTDLDECWFKTGRKCPMKPDGFESRINSKRE